MIECFTLGDERQTMSEFSCYEVRKNYGNP